MRNEEITILGKILEEAKDGGVLLQARDGRIVVIQAEMLVKHVRNNDPYEPFSQEEMSHRLLEELPDGFKVHVSAHCLICYDIDPALADSHATLFEKLYKEFIDYWTGRGFPLHEPEHPLVSIVFADKHSYQKFVDRELGSAVEKIPSFYSLKNNYICMYSKIGQHSAGTDISRVTNVIHSATNQLAYNCGLLTRYADVPNWFSQGLATYFEALEFNTSPGWNISEQVNRNRLSEFRRTLQLRPLGRLASYISDDERLQSIEAGREAHAEAWALTYFLSNKRPTEFVNYAQMLSRKKAVRYDSPTRRLQEFKQFFGDNVEALEAEFLSYIQQLQ
jgi:hypothetical protein